MAYDGVLQDFEDCVALKEPSRLPVFALGLEFDMAVAGVSCGESRRNVNKTVCATVEAVDRFGYDWAMVFPDDYIEFEPLGLRMRNDEDHPAMPSEYLPMTRDALATFTLPDETRDMRLPIHLEMIRRLKEVVGDTACVCGRIAAPFSALALIYGIDTLMVEMLVDPELIADNLQFFIHHQIAFGAAQFAAGADMLWLGDCVASSHFVSLPHYIEFGFPSAAAVAAGLSGPKKHIIYHSAETAIPYIKPQLDLPVSAINLGEGVNIAELKKTLQPKRCLMGNFDPTVLRDAGPERIAAETTAMIRENWGRYIFNTGEGIMANSPVENVEAMMRAAIAASGGDPK